MKTKLTWTPRIILLLSITLLATQIYPYIHFHGHRDKEGYDLSLCMHPMEFEHAGENHQTECTDSQHQLSGNHKYLKDQLKKDHEKNESTSQRNIADLATLQNFAKFQRQISIPQSNMLYGVLFNKAPPTLA